MTRTILTFGLISGAILSLMLLGTLAFHDAIGFDKGAVVGYTTMVLSFLLIYFGVRSYRDNVAGGRVGFGRALAVGALIAIVSSACYVVTWQVAYFGFMPDFVEKYQAHALEQARASGDTPEVVERKRAEFARFAELYRNPAINAAITFLEPMPVGLVIALVSAGILKRRPLPAS